MRVILRTLGFRKPCQACKDFGDQMDAWGWSGCAQRRAEIRDHLRKMAGKRMFVCPPDWTIDCLITLSLKLSSTKRD